MLDKLSDSSVSVSHGRLPLIASADRLRRLDELVAASEEEGLYGLPPRAEPRLAAQPSGQETAAR